MMVHSTTQFQEKVYAALRRVPRGRVTTYKELGAAVGCASPRAIGQALRCNPYAPAVPCHRVVASDGSIGGFKGVITGKSIEEKVRLLKQEGVVVRNGRILDFDRMRFPWRRA